MIQEQRLGDRIEQMGKEVRAWSVITKKQLLFRIAQLGLQDRVRLRNEIALRKSVKNRIRTKGGELDYIAFSFARHGIFLEHGVGKDRKVGSSRANQSKKQWIEPTLPAAIEDLADLLEKEYADIAAGELIINIPGIYQTKVSI